MGVVIWGPHTMYQGSPSSPPPKVLDMWVELPVCQDDAVPQASVAVTPDREDGVSRDVHLRILHWSARRCHGGLHRVLSLQLDREVAGSGAWNRASVVVFSKTQTEEDRGGWGRGSSVRGSALTVNGWQASKSLRL